MEICIVEHEIRAQDINFFSNGFESYYRYRDTLVR